MLGYDMKRFITRLFLYLFVIVYACIIIYTIYLMFITSRLKENREIFSNPLPLQKYSTFSGYENFSHIRLLLLFSKTLLTTLYQLPYYRRFCIACLAYC